MTTEFKTDWKNLMVSYSKVGTALIIIMQLVTFFLLGRAHNSPISSERQVQEEYGITIINTFYSGHNFHAIKGVVQNVTVTRRNNQIFTNFNLVTVAENNLEAYPFSIEGSKAKGIIEDELRCVIVENSTLTLIGYSRECPPQNLLTRKPFNGQLVLRYEIWMVSLWLGCAFIVVLYKCYRLRKSIV